MNFFFVGLFDLRTRWMRRRGQTYPTLPSAEPSRTSATRTEKKSLRKDRQGLRNTARCLEPATGAVRSAEPACVSAFCSAQMKRDTFHCVMGMLKAF